MAVIARDSVTLASITDLANVRQYYLLQSSTANPPQPPSTNPPPSLSGWTTTEPGYSAGATTSLYTIQLNVFSDGTFDYLPVQLSSSYEAAKQAWNKANTAQTAANNAQTAANNAVAMGTVRDGRREDDDTPTWYRTNYPKQIVHEFKKPSSLGVPGTGNYGTLTTNTVYGGASDSSGGPVQQDFVLTSGVVWHRTGLTDSWNPWVDRAGDAQAAAEAAQTAASNAQTAATNAQTSANGKNTRVTAVNLDPSGATAPGGLPWRAGDTWIKWDNATSRNVIGQWVRNDNNNGWQGELIAHQTISSMDVNKLVVFGAADINEAVIDKLVGNIALFDAFVGKTFTGGTFTGTTFQTSSSATVGLKMSTSGLVAYSGGSERLTIAADGTLTSKSNATFTNASLSGGTITGGTIRTAQSGSRMEMSAATGTLRGYVGTVRRVEVGTSSIGLYGTGGAHIGGLEASTEGHLTLRGTGGMDIGTGATNLFVIPATSAYIRPGTSVIIEPQTGGITLRSDFSNINLYRGTGTTPAIQITQDISIRPTRNLTMGDLNTNTVTMTSASSITRSATSHVFVTRGPATANTTWRIFPTTIGGTNRACLRFDGGNMPSTTLAANCHIDGNGLFYKSSSSARSKVAVQDIGVDPWLVLDVPVRDWYDQTEAEGLARSLDGEDEYVTGVPLRRIPGVVAEEVEDAGLSQFVTYDEDGHPTNVLYDRIALLLIPIVRDIMERMDQLERNPR